MTDHELLASISALSQQFGSTAYVRGGGGNTSCKNDSILYIKPSGISLGDMRPENFLPLSRERLNQLYTTRFSEDETARESDVVAFMAETVVEGHSGRPSVEAPLHNTFPQHFVVHTHPAAVNGMTCANNGAECCRTLFPDALWIPFTEPGYTLSMRVREEMQRYQAEQGVPPSLVFLGNHGVFVAHDEVEGVQELMTRIMNTVNNEIAKVSLTGEPHKAPANGGAAVDRDIAIIKATLGSDATAVRVDSSFAIPQGAITPDHIVYCKAALYQGAAAKQGLLDFYRKNGYWPRVIATPNAVYGCGATEKVAALALELAWDGALTVRYAGAFGGIHYLEQRFVDFIANWEVESYRQKVSQ